MTAEQKRTLIDRLIVPALLERLLAEQRTKPISNEREKRVESQPSA